MTPHVHLYTTLGIHPKYFAPPSMYEIINNLQTCLEVSNTTSDPNKKLVVVGECGLDSTTTTTTTIDHQVFVLQK